MTASHTFTEPRPVIVDDEYLSHCIWSEAKALRFVSGSTLAAERKMLMEAREMLNDALAKADAHIERNTPLPLLERMH